MSRSRQDDGRPCANAGGAEPLRGSRLMAYALPNLSISMLIVPIATIVPALYVKERGVALTTMGVVLMAARVFDAVADQLVGYLSDVTRSRWPGGRKSWLVLGGVVAMPAVYFLCAPPADAGAGYFTVWSLAAYLAWAMLLIPHTAWGAELSRDYHERTHIVAVRSVFGQIGTLMFLVTPLLLPAIGLAASTDITLSATRYVGLALLLLVPATVLPAVLLVPQGFEDPRSGAHDLMATLRALANNGPMRTYLSAYLLSEVGGGFFVSLIFLYVDAYLGLGPHFSMIAILANVATLVSLPLWEATSQRIGKKQSVALSWVGQALSLLALLFVPRDGAGLAAFTAIICTSSLFVGAAAVVTPSILGDIVDYDTLRTGGYRAGNYFALYSLVLKIVTAVGGGLAFVLLGWFGYDVARPESNGPAADRAMLLVFVVAPALLRLLSVLLLWRYPLDARCQGIIRRRLEQREARVARRT